MALSIIGVSGDFPLNDDWAYAEGVRHVLAGDGLVLPYVNAAAVAHVALGVVAVKLWGYSYATLRLCSILVTFAGATAFYLAAGYLRIPRYPATFLALVYAANPILVNITFGFMSDSTGLALNMIFFACLLFALSRKSTTAMIAAFLVLALAVSVRQSALIFVLLSPLCLSKRFGESPNRFAVFLIAITLPCLSLWYCDKLLLTAQLDSGSSYNDYEIVRQAHFSTLAKLLFSGPSMLLPAIGALGQVFCYLALFCIPALPVLLFSISSAFRQPAFAAKRTIGLAFLLLSSSLVTISICHQTMPFSENIWRFTTIGAQGILGIIRNPLSMHSRMILTLVSFVFAIPLVISFSWLVSLLRMKPLSWRVLVLVVSLFAGLGFLTLETFVLCSDRYYLIVLGPTLLAVGFFVSRFRHAMITPISIALLLVFSIYSVAGSQEYLSSNRARWRALDWLEARGLRASEIDGGYEYNVLRKLDVYTSKYRGDPPRDKWRWWPIRGEKYLISYSPVPGYKTVHTEQYFSCLDFKTRDIKVLEHIIDDLKSF